MAKINWLQLFGIGLLTAESTIPVFIHNPQSLQIEGVIVTQANNLFALLEQLQQQTSAGIPTGTPATVPAVTPAAPAAR